MPDIDAVITWVDGAEAAHFQKRSLFMSAAERPLHGNAINPHRWVDSDELSYCLRAIERNAPWIRRVWIITDDQQPRLNHLSPALRRKISIVDHREIFAGYEHVLPTFNSISIETMLWRIDGLAEKFLYFNDDVFVTTPVEPSDFFTEKGTVLRGHWADHGELAQCDIKRSEGPLLNHFNQIKSAALTGYGADNVFLSAHVVHPMRRSVMEKLFAERRDIFLENMAHRFRCTEQFLPQSLHNYACIREGSAEILEAQDHLHLPVGMCEELTVDEVRAELDAAASPGIKFLCINDLPALEQHIDDARDWIEYVIGLRASRPIVASNMPQRRSQFAPSPGL